MSKKKRGKYLYQKIDRAINILKKNKQVQVT